MDKLETQQVCMHTTSYHWYSQTLFVHIIVQDADLIYLHYDLYHFSKQHTVIIRVFNCMV